MSSTHCTVTALESLSLHGGVGLEYHEHLVGGSNDGMRYLCTAVTTEPIGVWGTSVVQNHVVVRALLVGLHLKLFKHQFDPVARSRREMPNTIFPTRIVVRIVGAEHLPLSCRDLMLAASFFAVVLIVVQSESVVARAGVRTHVVLTDVLAAAIIGCALVLISEENCCETAFLNTVIRGKLNA